MACLLTLGQPDEGPKPEEEDPSVKTRTAFVSNLQHGIREEALQAVFEKVNRLLTPFGADSGTVW